MPPGPWVPQHHPCCHPSSGTPLSPWQQGHPAPPRALEALLQSLELRSVGEICEELCLFKVPLGFWALNKHPGWGLGWSFHPGKGGGGEGSCAGAPSLRAPSDKVIN